MTRGADWSRAEVEATVSDYFDMLATELRGGPVNKAARNRSLRERLASRTRGAVEFKHQNISAVLAALNQPFVPGYKPAWNFQGLLVEVVARRLAEDAALAELMARAADDPAPTPTVTGLLGRFDARPPAAVTRPDRVAEPPALPLHVRRPPVNWIEREARNRSVGEAGELFALECERARLRDAGQSDLAARVEHVARTIGDGEGFDVRSFERDGSDRFIEVKTTAFAAETAFFLSRNEVDVSRAREAHYHLYRVYAFRSDPRLFTVRGRLDLVCHLEPSAYLARIT